MTTNPRSISIQQPAVLHERALEVMPDGVASFAQRQSPDQLYLSRAEGSRIYDIAGQAYIDYMVGAGALVLGHRHPKIIAAVEQALECGVPNIGVAEAQIVLAELLCQYVPSIEYVRFLPTGNEAVQAAIRIARKATGRHLIAKFEGGYHGQSENVMVSVNAEKNARGHSDAPERVPYHCELPDPVIEQTLILPFNDLPGTTSLIDQFADEIALVVIEPVLGFAGAIPAEKSFLEGLRKLTTRYGIVLVYDEIITGFRLAMGGGQELYDVLPDLTVLGKAIGGGMPIAAVGGRRDIMEWTSVDLHPEDYVFQSGTFSAFPMSVAAGVATIETLARERLVDSVNEMGTLIRDGLVRLYRERRIAAQVTGVGSVFHVHFTRDEVRDARTAEDADQNLINELHSRVLKRGIYFYQGRLGWLSSAHSGDDIGYTLDIFGTVVDEMVEEGKFDTLRI